MTHIGMDFDNTIVSYDEVFYRCALERGLIAPGADASKSGVRSLVRALPRGNEQWTALQAVVYGERMAEASFMPGAERFIRKCSASGFRVSVISHKTEFDAAGSGTNLRASALAWMRAKGFFSENGLGLSEADVCFEPTRAAKLERIAERGCSHFIDDLAEVLEEELFPAGVVRLHYNPAGCAPAAGSLCFDGWDGIYGYFFGV
ncbi:MAG TPA: hypothetical protein PKK31_05030 [Elusimicrobiales bacterium]|nr:hypothetical protein [Elusimicrobiales bacterium]